MRVRGRVARLRRVFEKACVVYVCVSIPLAVAFERGVMVSGSMAPTLKGSRETGDMVLIDRVTYRFREPRRGELVYFLDIEGQCPIKRVVGLPGEVISIAGGRVVVDGQPLSYPAVFADLDYHNAGAFSSPARRFRVRPGHVFVLGDDSADSFDSRYWGALDRKHVLGRAVAIVSPWHRIRTLRPSHPLRPGMRPDA